MIKKRYIAQEKREMYWWDIRIPDGNRKRRVRGRATSISLARQAMAEAKADAARGTYEFRADRLVLTLKQLVDSWLDQQKTAVADVSMFSRRSTLKRFAALIGPNTEVRSLSKKDLERYEKKRIVDGRSVSTVNKELRIIFQCLRAVADLFPSLRNYRPPRIELKPDPNPRRQRVLTQQEIHTGYDAAHRRGCKAPVEGRALAVWRLSTRRYQGTRDKDGQRPHRAYDGQG
jgi:hypothetical protein